MHLGLNWLAQSIALSLTLNGLIHCSYSSSSSNVLDGKRFENCVNTILSKYPFISKKDLRKFNRILKESEYHLGKDPSGLTGGKGMRLFEKELSDLLTKDDAWRDSREEAYISAVERCSLLVSGNPENDLLKEFLSFDRYKRHLSSSKDRSMRNRRRHSKVTSKKSDKEHKMRSKRDVASYAFASSSAGGQGGFQTGNPIEIVIRSTLIESSFFTRVFHPGLAQTDAKVIAQDITKAGFFGYNEAFINDAVNAVTGALSFTTPNTNSANYAFILARSIAEILKRYDLMSVANGNQIANNMIREIQRLLEDTPQVQAPMNANQGTEASKGSVVAQTGGNNQRQNFPPIQPSPVMPRPEDRVAIFRNKLMSLLAESRELSNFFCQSSSPNIFQTIKTALSDYGLKIAVNAAVVATDAFGTMNSEQSCTQYANVLSEVIRDVLFDNGMLESVKPEDIALKVVSNAKAFSNPSPSLPPETQKENFKSSLPLLPSFPEVSVVKKEESYDSSGTIQKGFLNPPTQVPNLYEAKEQNPTPAIKTPEIQPTAFQPEPSNQRAVDVREKEQNPIQAQKPPPTQATAFRPEPSNQRAVSVRDDAFAFIVKLDLINTLSHSDRFASVFKPGILPNDAANYASKMARAVFLNYNPAILLPADSEIREAIFKLPIGSQTSDYAEAFAFILTDILSKNGFIRNADSKYIGDTVINVLDREVMGESAPGESFGRITTNPPILFAPKVSTPQPESHFKIEQLKQNVSSGFADQSYATTPTDISRFSEPQKQPNLSTAQYEFVPTSTMAPQIATTQYVPDYTQASEFVNAFMHAFEMFPSAPDPNYRNFSDAVVDDPRKLSGILEEEMESSMRALSQPESSQGKESDSKVPESTTDNSDRKQTDTGKLEVPSGFQTGVQNASTENVRIATSSAQPEAVGRHPSPKLESSFAPTPATSLDEESQKEQERKSEILKKVFSISTSGITFIRSPNFNLQELCTTLNGYAEVVGIEPLPNGNCAEIPLIDYLLHVLREVSSPSKKA